jgi:hypothetical protein
MHRLSVGSRRFSGRAQRPIQADRMPNISFALEDKNAEMIFTERHKRVVKAEMYVF